MRPVRISVLVLLSTLALSVNLSPAQSQDAETLVKSMLEARQKLLSGTVTVTGKKLVDGGDDVPKKWNGTLKGKIDFDNIKSRVRFEWEETHRARFMAANAGLDRLKEKDSSDITTFNMFVQFVRNKDYAAFCTLDAPTVCSNIAVFEPTLEYVTGHNVSHFYRYLDVMACNVNDFDSFRKGRSAKEAHDALLEMSPKVVDVNKKTVRLTYGGADLGPAISILVRTEGYVPLEYTWADEPSGATFKSKANWVSKDGVDVPSSYHFVWDFPLADDHCEYLMLFKWQNVNQKLDDSLFDYNSFKFVEVQKRIYVVDHRDPDLPAIGTVNAEGKITQIKPDQR